MISPESVLGPSLCLVVDGEYRVRESGQWCHELMWGKNVPCPECPIQGRPRRCRPTLRIERTGPGDFELVEVRRLEQKIGESPAFVCERRPFLPDISRALEVQRAASSGGFDSEFVANKLQGLMLGAEILRRCSNAKNLEQKVALQMLAALKELVIHLGLSPHRKEPQESLAATAED